MWWISLSLIFFKFRQYKNVNSANFVYCEKTRLAIPLNWKQCAKFNIFVMDWMVNINKADCNGFLPHNIVCITLAAEKSHLRIQWLGKGSKKHFGGHRPFEMPDLRARDTCALRVQFFKKSLQFAGKNWPNNRFAFSLKVFYPLAGSATGYLEHSSPQLLTPHLLKCLLNTKISKDGWGNWR